MLQNVFAYVKLFATFSSGEKVIRRLQGSELNLAYIAGGDAGGGGGEKGGGGEDGVTTGGFSQPILVSDKTGLDLNIPHPSFSVEDVENYVGEFTLGSLMHALN